MKMWYSMVAVVFSVLILGLAGCATETYVQQQVSELQKQIETNKGQIAMLESSDAEQNEKLERLSDTAREALTRAEELNKLVEGKFLFETTLNEEVVYFDFDKSTLSEKAKENLQAFARRLKDEDRNCFIEIQGHTDRVGSEAYNFKLGLDRARAVMTYLYTEQNIPLSRINTFSYGESKPAFDGKTNRAKNRRVTLVVMR